MEKAATGRISWGRRYWAVKIWIHCDNHFEAWGEGSVVERADAALALEPY